MKRTTLVLDESCLEGVREIAHIESKNLSQVVNELLVEGIQRRKMPQRSDFKLPSFSMGKPGVNLGDRNMLEALMDS